MTYPNVYLLINDLSQEQIPHLNTQKKMNICITLDNRFFGTTKNKTFVYHT